MPFDKTKYPADWRAISWRIRQRDRQECKWCGVKNGQWVLRDAKGEPELIWNAGWRDPQDGHIQVWWENEEGDICSDTDSYLSTERHPIKIVLTVAHIDHDSTHNTDDNLAALCQQCHLRHDAKQHAANAKITRGQKQRAAHAQAGQIELFDT